MRAYMPDVFYNSRYISAEGRAKRNGGASIRFNNEESSQKATARADEETARLCRPFASRFLN